MMVSVGSACNSEQWNRKSDDDKRYRPNQSCCVLRVYKEKDEDVSECAKRKPHRSVICRPCFSFKLVLSGNFIDVHVRYSLLVCLRDSRRIHHSRLWCIQLSRCHACCMSNVSDMSLFGQVQRSAEYFWTTISGVHLLAAHAKTES